MRGLVSLAWTGITVITALCCIAFPQVTFSRDRSPPESSVRLAISKFCVDCHEDGSAEGGLDFSRLDWALDSAANRDRWIRVFDRVATHEMPPDRDSLPDPERDEMLTILKQALVAADQEDIRSNGRGLMRRLTRDEYQQNLRDILSLPNLDVRDYLPEDREAFHFNKSAHVLDLSRVQLGASLDAADAALKEALAETVEAPPTQSYRAIGRNLFAELGTFGNREAMFFARDSAVLDNGKVGEWENDESVELALFRSAHWPYYGYPRGFVAKADGEYRVRFSARAVRQLPGGRLEPAEHSVPMTFRARKPSGPDVSGDVRATGGLMDILPEQGVYETTVLIKAGETIEYSLLGLPVPLARNVNGKEPTYRYPPFPEGGQPGIAFQSLEIEGPIAVHGWPPRSRQLLFDHLPVQAATSEGGVTVEAVSQHPREDARRLLRSFIARAARQPVPEEGIVPFEQLVITRLDEGDSFTDAMLIGYQAFLTSGHFLFLQEPRGEMSQYAIANRLSHFLTNSRPDAQLMSLADAGRLRDHHILIQETDRLIRSPEFERFVKNFTDYWLSLRHLSRDEPDILRHPEYRFDHYLVESMERETRTFVTAMVRDNLPAHVIISADFAYVNDRLARHYGFPPVEGSAMRKVSVPQESPYGGLLTQAAILKVTANGTSTSPIVRGAWIMDRLIGQPPPPPPPNVPAVEPDIRGAKTIRDLLALHTQSSSCASCHAKFDPVGLALENFDILGGWRTRYRGLEEGERVTGIDRAGHDYSYTLASPVDASGVLLNGETFQDIQDLKKLFGAKPRDLARNLLHQFTVYATGTPVRFSEREKIEQILNHCAGEDYRVGDLLRGLVTSSIFLGSAEDFTELMGDNP